MGNLNKIKNDLSERFLILTTIFIAIGIILMLCSSIDTLWVNNEFLQNLLAQIGSFLAISFSISMIWDLFGKRKMLDEVLLSTNISKEVTNSGLIGIIESFPNYNNWRTHFVNSSTLDIFFAYGSAWRSNLRFEINNFIKRKGNRIRVVMPDPDDTLTIQELARRFDYKEDQLIGKIREAETDFRNFAEIAQKNDANVEIWYIKAAIVHSFYKFDRVLIFALFTHQRDKIVKVPSFICEKSGTLFEFFEKEFNTVLEPSKSMVRKVE